MNLKKFLNNCIPLIGIAVTFLCCSILGQSGYEYELLFFLALLIIPVISNLVFIIANFKLNGSRKVLDINSLLLLFHPLLLIVLYFFSDDGGKNIIFLYILYILVVDIIELSLAFILCKMRKLKLPIYAGIIIILFVSFFLLFYNICYLF